MKNSFEQLGGTGIKEKEPEVEIAQKDVERAETKESSDLALSARKEADSILARAYGISGKEGIDMEKDAYKIYAALDALGVELPESIKKTVDNLVETKRIVGFSSEGSAKDFLQEVVGNTKDMIENTEDVMAA